MSLTPDPDATSLADAMLASELPETVIEETLASATDPPPLESGRTVCGDFERVLEPLQRYPVAVDYDTCTRGERMGIMHTHPGNLQRPVHSVPDIANIVYGLADASVVAGSEQSDVLVGPHPDDRTAATEAMTAALGFDPGGADGVLSAIERGAVDNPARVRRQLRSSLSPLFDKRRTPIAGATAQDTVVGSTVADEDTPVGAAPVVIDARGTVTSTVDYAAPMPTEVRQKTRVATSGVRHWLSKQPVEIRGIVLGTVIGDLVSTGVDRLIISG